MQYVETRHYPKYGELTARLIDEEPEEEPKDYKWYIIKLGKGEEYENLEAWIAAKYRISDAVQKLAMMKRGVVVYI